jgi:peptidoglycan/LPS O-acetylase OafA/YrhL
MEIKKYPSLNGLRALSITLVIIYHLDLQTDIFKSLLEIWWCSPFIKSFLNSGNLGVNVFFVISGFLITSLLLQEEMNSNAISIKNFYIRRTLRIFPAYYTMLLVYLILQFYGYIQISKISWLTAITYTKYFNGFYLDWYTRHAWSLSVEEHFYIIWPLIFTIGKNIRKYFTIFLIIIVPVIKIYLNFHPIFWISDYCIFTRVDSIAVGCFVAFYIDRIVKKLEPHWTKVFCLSAIILFLMWTFPSFANKLYLSGIFSPIRLARMTIVNSSISLIVVYSVFGPKGIWYRILNLKIINYIGLLSYSLYLWQEVFIFRTTYWFNLFPLNIFLVLISAVCSYYLIEKPFLKLKSKYSKNSQQRTISFFPEKITQQKQEIAENSLSL